MPTKPAGLIVAVILGYVWALAEITLAMLEFLGAIFIHGHNSDYVLVLFAAAVALLVVASVLISGTSRWAYVVVAVLHTMAGVLVMATAGDRTELVAIAVFLMAGPMIGAGLVLTGKTRDWFLHRSRSQYRAYPQ